MTYNEKRAQSIGKDPKMIQIELAEKDMKMVILTIFNMVKKAEEIYTLSSCRRKYVRKQQLTLPQI